MDSPLQNRLVSSSINRETSGQPQAASRGRGRGGRSQLPTLNDAILFLNDVKATFQDRRETFSELVKIINDFRFKRINEAVVAAMVKELFKEHPELILRFNRFLPEPYEIALPLENPVQFSQAVDFVNKVKARFQDNDHVYKTFLDKLSMYRNGIKSRMEVYREVVNLFNDHYDLIQEFKYFMPGVSRTIRQEEARVSDIRADRDLRVRRGRISHIRN